MPTIKLTDQFGLDVDAQPAPTSALLKYFQQLPSLRFDSLDVSKIGGLTLDQPAVTSLSAGLVFQNPISLGSELALNVAGGAHGSLRILLDSSDLPGRGDSFTLPPDTCYVAFEMEAQASAMLSAGVAGAQFGAGPATRLALASCSRFPLHGGVTLLQAWGQTVAGFSLPVHAGDLADMPAGQITRAAVRGSLQISGSADLLATTNPLASANLPAPLPAVTVSAGGSVTVGVSCRIDADFEVVVRKLDNGAVRLAWYHKNAESVAIHAQASESIAAGFNGTDLFSQVVGAISANPQADLAELARAGVPDDQAAAIQGAVAAAVARKLEIAVGAELSWAGSQAATFLYEIVSGALTDAGRAAVDQALRGDLTGLHAPGLPGVSCVRSIWDQARKRGLVFNVNLLGILNYRSVSTLSLEGTVLHEPATGALVITDQATAQRIKSTQVNFGADTDKLRHVMAEAFLVTAAYQGARQEAEPALRLSHCYFQLSVHTSGADILREMRAGLAVGLLQAGELRLPDGVTDFGRTMFALSSDYGGALATSMFVDSDGAALPREAYESAGRAAIQFVVGKTDDDVVRRQPAIDDTLWARMKETGQPGFAALFPGVPAPLLGAIVADYSTIEWWADAMRDTARQLALVRQWLVRNPAASPEEPAFQQLRASLAMHLRQVAATTREEFGQPWGLIAMDLLTNHQATARMRISSPRFALTRGDGQVAAMGS